MKTTKKRRGCLRGFIAVAAAGTLLTACGPPGASELKKGERDIQAGRFTEAEAELKEAVRILGDSPAAVQAKALNLLGLACQNGGQWDAASKAYLQALKLDRNNAAIDYNLGCLRSQQSDFPAAIEYLTTYTTLRRNDVQGYLRLGTAYFRLAAQQRSSAERARLLEYARREFEAAEKVSPTAEAANALGVLKLQSRSPGTESIRLAGTNFALALRRDPQYSPALLNLAIFSQEYARNPRRALDLYRDYLKITPAPPRANEVARLAHDLDLSLRISITPEPAPAPAPKPALRPAPPAAKVNAEPANPVAAMPRPPPAEEPPPVQPVAPKSAPAQTQTPASAPVPIPQPAPPPQPAPNRTPPPALVHVPLDASPSDNSPNAIPEPIVTDTNAEPRKTILQRLNPLRLLAPRPKPRLEALPPEEPPVRPGTRYEYPAPITFLPGERARAVLLTGQAARARQDGDLALSIRTYKEAEDADSTYYDAYEGLGLASIQARDYRGALEALDRALALQEDSAQARYAFAWTLQKRGFTEDAVHELEKLLAQHPDDARGHLLLGNLFAEKLKEPRLAREHYLRVLALDPANAQAANVRAWLQKNP